MHRKVDFYGKKRRKEKKKTLQIRKNNKKSALPISHET